MYLRVFILPFIVSDCRLNGLQFAVGGNVKSSEDSCVKCTCQKNGMTCSKNACPVLQCPPSMTVLDEGACCPRCNGEYIYEYNNESKYQYIPHMQVFGDISVLEER